MQNYQFNETIYVDGVLRTAGDVLPAAAIPAGCLASLLYTRRVVAAPAPPATGVSGTALAAGVSKETSPSGPPEPAPAKKPKPEKPDKPAKPAAS